MLLDLVDDHLALVGDEVALDARKSFLRRRIVQIDIVGVGVENPGAGRKFILDSGYELGLLAAIRQVIPAHRG